MAEAPSPGNYGTTRERAASVSFADIETVARQLMAGGGYPSVAAVRKALKRGSTTTIADAMRRFWKDQAALNAGNPVALTRLPPEFADAAVNLWEQALRLSQQRCSPTTTPHGCVSSSYGATLTFGFTPWNFGRRNGIWRHVSASERSPRHASRSVC